MKTWLWVVLIAAGVATAGCGASSLPSRAPARPVSTTETVLTIEPTPVVTVTVPPTSAVATSAPAPAAKTTPVRKTPTRKPPQFGYQCRDGDESKYDVCAGHKAWVDGQREFTDCLNGGGTWDIDTQRCKRN